MCGVIVVRRWIRFRIRISEETLSGMGLRAKRCVRGCWGMWSLHKHMSAHRARSINRWMPICSDWGEARWQDKKKVVGKKRQLAEDSRQARPDPYAHTHTYIQYRCSVCGVLYSVGTHTLCLKSKLWKDCRPLLSGKSLGVVRCLLPRLSALFWRRSEYGKRVIRRKVCVPKYTVLASNKHKTHVRVTQTHTHFDLMWHQCSSPVSSYTARQMVVLRCRTSTVHPDCFICLFVFARTPSCSELSCLWGLPPSRFVVLACWHCFLFCPPCGVVPHEFYVYSIVR